MHYPGQTELKANKIKESANVMFADFCVKRSKGRRRLQLKTSAFYRTRLTKTGSSFWLIITNMRPDRSVRSGLLKELRYILNKGEIQLKR
jgi:hypothetical protein